MADTKPSTLVADLLLDLAAESEELDALVADLSGEQWLLPTPAEGWTIADTIAHLHQTDLDALLALTDPGAFERLAKQAAEAEFDPNRPGYVDSTVISRRGTAPAELLESWRTDRARLGLMLGELPAGTRVHWFGPPMSVPSFITARLQETWAHGQDVADALGVVRVPTARLRHIADLGVRARAFAYAIHGRPVPSESVRVELQGPGGQTWTWGEAAVPDRIAGPALDFCLLVTRRRHPSDLDLEVSGPRAKEWFPIAQSFAGPPGSGRAPLSAGAAE